MKPREGRETGKSDLFKARLDQIIDMTHPPVRLAQRAHRDVLEDGNAGLALALILALNLGRREGDLIRLTWGDYRGEFMHVSNRRSNSPL